MYVVANILTLYRMERLRMVSRGLETLKNIPNSIYLSQKMNFRILFNRPVTSQQRQQQQQQTTTNKQQTTWGYCIVT